MADRKKSPQERAKCACAKWTNARECLRYRYSSNSLEDWEICECACHAEDDDDAN